MTWSYVELPGGNLEKDLYAADEPIRWAERYLAYIAVHGHPDPGFGVFSREEGHGKDRVFRDYFTPEAEHWGRQFNARPCEKPENSRYLSLSTGPNSAWDIHYPDKN